ncbi:hypothetical protein KR067_013447, partial [Drosophila pandora]
SSGLKTSWLVHSLVLTVMVHLSTQTEHLNSTLDICRLFPNGAKIRKPGGCTEYLECNNHVRSSEIACSGKTPYFRLKTQKCDTKVDDSYCKTPCTSKTQGYVGDSINCAHWHLCEGSKSMATGSCPDGQYFDNVSGACVYPKDTVCVATFELCDIAPMDVPFRDEYNCNKYFSCDKDAKLVTNTCEAGKYFNVATSSCVAKKDVVCEEHPVPDDVCGTKKLAFRNKFVSDQSTCRGYFYCRDLGSGIPDTNPTFFQCGEEYFFNEERQACMPRDSQKCSQDRCDGREDGHFEIAETKGCHEYYICKDGREDEIRSCEDKYFDVATQQCTDTVKSYGACSA